MSDLSVEYDNRYRKHLQEVASNLEKIIRDYLGEMPRIDSITARAKSPERFSQKARSKDQEGNIKYKSPLTEIQDIIGARIVVFYGSDVDPVTEGVLRYFRHIEEKEVVPDSYWEFGYFGKHLILALPADAIPGGIGKDELPSFFELQIKTLFQHAWSEANHDLGYKPPGPLTGEQTRLLSYTAAQAWGADQAFDNLRSEVAPKAGVS